MSSIIATNSCHRQQLIRGPGEINLQPMVANSKNDFAQRLAQACNEAKNPIPDGRGRRAELRRRVLKAGLEVSGESVRKWLSADAIPSMDNLRFIAVALNVDADWLLTGREPQVAYGKGESAQVECREPAAVIYGQFNATIAKVVSIMEYLDEPQQNQILGFAIGLSQANNQDAQNSTRRAGQ